MLRSKTTPWTRFPSAKGGMFYMKQTGWANPVAFRNPAQVKSRVKQFLVDDVDGRLTVPQMTDPSESAKWEKFWYAADMLYRWVNQELVEKDGRRSPFELTEAQVKCYTWLFLRCKDITDMVEAYTAAGLLGPESADTWRLFRYCRNDDLTLTKDAKDKLMNQLLDERRKVVDMFEKMQFVKAVSLFFIKRGVPVGESIKRVPLYEKFDPAFNFMYGRWVDYNNLQAKRRKEQIAAQTAMQSIINAEVDTDQVEPAGAAENQKDVQVPETDESRKRRLQLEKKADYSKKRRAHIKGAFEAAGGHLIKREHFPPYDTNYREGRQQAESYLLGATQFYELLGKCQCVDKCPGAFMLMGKCTPWTRFPTRNGTFSGATWENPKPLRFRSQVETEVTKFLVIDSSGTMQPDFTGKPNECRYEKFWYAVAKLYDWCLGTSLIPGVPAVLINAFFNVQGGLRTDFHREYQKAGLLGPETFDDWKLFRNCRDGDMSLNTDAKNDLMHILLRERRRAVDLFEKMQFLEDMVKRFRVISPLTDEQKQQHLAAKKTSDAQKNTDQKAAAAEMDKIRSAEKADASDLDAARILLDFARQASPALGDTSRAGGAAAGGASHAGAVSVSGQSHDTSVLLKCLERLALEEWC